MVVAANDHKHVLRLVTTKRGALLTKPDFVRALTLAPASSNMMAIDRAPSNAAFNSGVWATSQKYIQSDTVSETDVLWPEIQ